MADWLILESTREEIIALEVRTGPEGAEVLGAARASLVENFAAEPDVLAEQIRKLTAQVSAKQVVLVVPREAVVFRQFELPAVPPEELPDLVRFQAATKFSTPVEELTLDYIPFTPPAEGMGLTVVAASLDKDLLARWRKACEMCGLNLNGCTVSSVGLTELVARAGELPGLHSPPTLILYGEENKLELTLVDDGAPLFSSIVHVRVEGQSPGRLLDRELKRAQVVLSESDPGVDIAKAVICGPSVVAREWLDQNFPGRWTELDLKRKPIPGVKIQGDPAKISLPALGAALAQESPRVPGVDFLRPRRPPQKRDVSKYQLAAIIGGVTLLLLLSYGGFSWRLSSLEAEAKRIDIAAANLTAENKQQAPILQQAGDIRAWDATRHDPVQFLIQLQKQMPGTDRLYFEQLNVDPVTGDASMKVTGNGHARERADVQEMLDNLSEHGFRVIPKAINRGTKDPDYPITFDLDIELLRNSSGS